VEQREDGAGETTKYTKNTKSRGRGGDIRESRENGERCSRKGREGRKGVELKQRGTAWCVVRGMQKFTRDYSGLLGISGRHALTGIGGDEKNMVTFSDIW
jgi:hypothetical protein